MGTFGGVERLKRADVDEGSSRPGMALFMPIHILVRAANPPPTLIDTLPYELKSYFPTKKPDSTRVIKYFYAGFCL